METPQPFTVSRATIFMTISLCPRTGWLLWIVCAIGLALCLSGCIADIRLLILGLIVILTVLPTMAFFIFVNYMFATEMVANLLHHTIERRGNGYLLRIYRPADADDPLESGKEWIESGRLTLFDANEKRRKYAFGYDVIFYKDSPLAILYVPRQDTYL